jgi:NIMA-interacting peptidyl-prolyl cis-trans isomerase 1
MNCETEAPAAAAPVSNTPSQIRASHLLVKHRDVRNPRSWKELNVTRSKEEALAMIEEFEKQLRSSGQLQADFAALASVESHCSSAKRGGDLGVFGRGAMMKAFEEPAFALNVGEMSGPVFSDSGVHLILRTE